MQSYENGYADERFQHPVGQSLHCIICTNVFKDPVMCYRNEHLFCRACITRHLMSFQTCPSCMEPLTVNTLSQAPRTVTNLLSELMIRCEFFDRGCGKVIELADLERHVKECGFAPAVCSNEGCQMEMNKHDLLYHETIACELRQCHSCNDVRHEMDTVMANLAEMNEKLDRNDSEFENIKAVAGNVVVKVEMFQQQIINQEKRNRKLEADNVEMKRSLNEITKQMEQMMQQAPHGVDGEQRKTKKKTDGLDEPMVVVAGGWNGHKDLWSVEMFSLSKKKWTLLRSMKKRLMKASSIIHNNCIIFVGGSNHLGGCKSMVQLPRNPVPTDRWKKVPAVLPERLSGHCCVAHNGTMFVIGGKYPGGISDSITKISLAPPYTSKVLATMPQRRWLHGVALFDDKILILGGREDMGCDTNLSTILLYDITKNECLELAPLLYPVSNMATVKCNDENAMIIGGVDNDSEPLNTVSVYNVKSQKSHMLPEMKIKRRGCVAGVVEDTVVVMGGQDERRVYLRSVESFIFQRYTWEQLPDMIEARCLATAVVC